MTAARRSLTVTVLAPVIVAVLTASAFAFWRTTGSGTGNGAAASTWTENTGVAPTVVFSPVTAGSGHRNVFSGTTTIKTGTLTIRVYTGSTVTGSPVKTYTAPITQTGSAPFSWTVTTGNSDLSGQVTAQVTHVDGANTSNQPSRTFTAA